MKSYTFKTHKTARYLLSEEPNENHKVICYALHGYGQLATYFIKKFTSLERKDILFVAPEGLSRFYLKDSSGRVGATWMTKEERLADIKDYCHYLEGLSEFLEQNHSFEKRILLGFSQGVATACRWLMHNTKKFDAVINWAGAFPPDLDYKEAYLRFAQQPTYLAVGSQDEYISEKKLQEHLQFLKSQKIGVNLKRFNGKHTINEPLLAEILGEIIPRPNP